MRRIRTDRPASGTAAKIAPYGAFPGRGTAIATSASAPYLPTDGPSPSVAITDLLYRIPIPPSIRRGGAEQPAAPPPAADTTWMADAWSGYAEAAGANAGTAARRHPGGPSAGLPSWAVLALGSLTLTTLGLLALLVLGARPAPATAADGLSEPATEAATRPPDEPADEPAGETATSAQPSDSDSATVSAPEGAPAGADATPAAFSAAPRPIPVGLITRLEAASNEPLHRELTHLLTAVQHGFGAESAQLEPSLRSYVYRMASRFEWNPDTFIVAVTAPTPALAEARSATLRRLFGDAVASRRLVIRPAVGPDALTLVPR